MAGVANSVMKVSWPIPATAVGTTSINGSVIDTAGFDGCLFVARAGTITDGAFDLKCQQGTDATVSDAADLAGSKVSLAITDDSKCLVLNIHKPLERYLRPVIVRGGATGSVIDGCCAILYGASQFPTSHDAVVIANEAWVSPAEGTA